MNRTMNDEKEERPSDTWTDQVAIWLGLSEKKTRWFLIVVVLVVILAVSVGGSLWILPPQVVPYAIVFVVGLVGMILVFALVAHSRSSPAQVQRSSKRRRLRIDAGDTRIDWTDEQRPNFGNGDDTRPSLKEAPVSYTHLTLPTNREV